jgi:hemolysin activation/secretion protein
MIQRWACTGVAFAWLAAQAMPLMAQTIPDAGQSLRSVEQAPPPLPERQTLDLNLPDTPTTPAPAQGPLLTVKGFRLSGNRLFGDQDLQPLLVDLKDRTLSLGQLQEAARRITGYYREHGYLLARAYLPAQEIERGMVRIEVLEGRYGEVRINNTSRLRTAVAAAPLSTLKGGEPVRVDELERSLLLLNDLPGIAVRSTLKPGAAVGTSDLLVDVRPGVPISGAVDLDNYGNRYTGQYRLDGSLDVNDPMGLGDRLSLRALATSEHQHYGRAGYQLPVGSLGTQLGAAYSSMDYSLGKDFDVLDAYGVAHITSIYATQPLVRRRAFALSASLQFDDKRLKDNIDLYGSHVGKRDRVVTASLAGNSRDDFWGGGVNSFALAWSHGSLDIHGALNRDYDRLTARTDGHFNKVNPSVVRLQKLTDRFSLYVQAQGQWADGNLDSSEKFSLGGVYGVRAYPEGEAAGDQGWLANLELRYALTSTWQLLALGDHGEARINHRAWSEGENHRSLSAAGVGAIWAYAGWRLNMYAAWRVGGGEPRSDSHDRNPRLWAQFARYF